MLQHRHSSVLPVVVGLRTGLELQHTGLEQTRTGLELQHTGLELQQRLAVEQTVAARQEVPVQTRNHSVVVVAVLNQSEKG